MDVEEIQTGTDRRSGGLLIATRRERDDIEPLLLALLAQRTICRGKSSPRPGFSPLAYLKP